MINGERCATDAAERYSCVAKQELASRSMIRRFVVARSGRKKGGLLTISGSVFHVDEPLWAVKTAIRLSLEIGAGGRPEVCRRLKHLLFGDRPSPTPELSAVAELLALDEELEIARLPNASPSRLKELTLDTLISAAMRIARSAPLLLVVEDAQWLDPTSMELLIRLVEVARHCRIMVLLSAREDFSFLQRSKQNREQLSLEAIWGRRTQGRFLPKFAEYKSQRRSDRS